MTERILPVRSTCGTPSPAQGICRPEEILCLHPGLVQLPGEGRGNTEVGRCCRPMGPGGCSRGGHSYRCAPGWGGAERWKKLSRRQRSLGVEEEGREEAVQ